MNFFLIFTITIAAFTALASAQLIVLPEVDGFVSSFVVKIHRGTATNFVASGVLVSLRHVVTIASPLQGINAADIRVHFGNTRLTGSDSGAIDLITRHPSFNATQPLENNLAVLRILQADANRLLPTVFMPLPMGNVRMDHFCTMLGFGSLVSTPQNLAAMNMLPALAMNSTECGHLFRGDFFCTSGTPSQFPLCGGFVGAPIICDGTRLAGLVTQDQFCGVNPRAYIINMQHHHEWIGRVSGGGKAVVSLLVMVLGVVVGKLF
jgi:hypothetical protein